MRMLEEKYEEFKRWYNSLDADQRLIFKLFVISAVTLATQFFFIKLEE